MLTYMDATIVAEWLTRSNTALEDMTTYCSQGDNFVQFAHFWLSEFPDTQKQEIYEMEHEILVEEVGLAFAVGKESRKVPLGLQRPKQPKAFPRVLRPSLDPSPNPARESGRRRRCRRCLHSMTCPNCLSCLLFRMKTTCSKTRVHRQMDLNRRLVLGEVGTAKHDGGTLMPC